SKTLGLGCSNSPATTPPSANSAHSADRRGGPPSAVNDLSTQRAQTGAHEGRQEPSAVTLSCRLSRTYAPERPRGRTTTCNLITRRTQVQILPPPPNARKRRSEALSEKSEGASVVPETVFGFLVNQLGGR